MSSVAISSCMQEGVVGGAENSATNMAKSSNARFWKREILEAEISLLSFAPRLFHPKKKAKHCQATWDDDNDFQFTSVASKKSLLTSMKKEEDFLAAAFGPRFQLKFMNVTHQCTKETVSLAEAAMLWRWGRGNNHHQDDERRAGSLWSAHLIIKNNCVKRKLS